MAQEFNHVHVLVCYSLIVIRKCFEGVRIYDPFFVLKVVLFRLSDCGQRVLFGVSDDVIRLVNKTFCHNT